MKLNKFIIPVGISLAAFIWGYRGELWLGRVSPTKDVVSTPESEIPENTKPVTATAVPNTTGRPGTPISPTVAMPGGSPITAREMPLTTPGPGEEYAPEDDGQEEEEEITEEGDDEGIDPEADQADDQSLPEDEPGADSPENEEVDLGSNEGDLEGDETADTAETKPVKP